MKECLMASFESRVSGIFNENLRLARKIPFVIRQIYDESESEFKKRFRDASEDVGQYYLLRLYDILFIDFFFDELNDRFLNWVIDNYPDQFNDIELLEMRAQADSYIDFYEIQEVIPGRGSYIKSLFTNIEGFMHDVSSSSHLAKWDIVLSRCYLFQSVYYVTGSLSLFDPIHKNFIVDQIKKARSEKDEFSQNSDYSRFAKDHYDIFFKIERDIREMAKNKRYYTNYGELQLCEVRYRVLDLQSILTKIDTLDEFNFIETKMRKDKKKRIIKRYQFDWFTLGIEEELDSIKTVHKENGILFSTSQLDANGNQMGIEVIGSLYIDQLLCRLETRSLELAEFARRHFIDLFGKALDFKRILKMPLNFKPEPELNKKQSDSEKFTQQNPKLLAEIEEKYYLSLLDEKIPALDNMSPREASDDLILRPLLIDWLKGLENSIERKRLAGEKVISINKIKKALNINW